MAHGELPEYALQKGCLPKRMSAKKDVFQKGCLPKRFSNLRINYSLCNLIILSVNSLFSLQTVWDLSLSEYVHFILKAFLGPSSTTSNQYNMIGPSCTKLAKTTCVKGGNWSLSLLGSGPLLLSLLCRAAVTDFTFHTDRWVHLPSSIILFRFTIL